MLSGLIALSALLATACASLIRRVRRSTREHSQVRDDRDRLVHSVRHDALSGLLNRFGIVERLNERLDAGRDDFSVLYLDIDRFKTINDTLGHTAGDVLLSTVARRLEHVLGARGDAARIGGDEFVVIVDDSAGVDGRSLADRISRSIVEPVEINGRLLRVSASIGVAVGPWTERSAVAVLEHANQALHGAKEHGRDRVEVFTIDMRNDEQRRAHDESELRRAIDRGDVRPFFEPEFDVRSGRLVGTTVVPRWIRDDGTIADEHDLRTIARDANTVERLTAAVVREARPFVRRFELLGLPNDFRFRVELPRRCTPRAWRDGQIAAAFHDVDLSPFTLEVHPSVVAVDRDNAVTVLEGLRRRGARICLRNVDDLTTVGAIDVDEIRLSGQPVHGRRPIDDAILLALTDLARRLELVVSADGVGNEDDARRLDAAGCHRQQGVYHGAAVPPDEFQTIVENDLVNHWSEPSVP